MTRGYNIYYAIKDASREGLLPFLDQALSVIPEFSAGRILDAGCGTGVPALELARLLNTGEPDKKNLFRQELAELAAYRKDPAVFRSIYYVVQRL